MKLIRSKSANKKRSTTQLLATALLALTLSACGGGGEDDGGGGGIIGTGLQLDGTVHNERLLAASDLEIRSASGERSVASIDSRGRFETEIATASEPLLLRADLGNGNAFYSLADADGVALAGSDITQNVHAFTDLAIRNWFGTQGLDIDAEFDGASAISDLPTAAELAAIEATITALITPSLELYNIAGTDLSTVSFDNDGLGVDDFLDRNSVLINNGNITIIIVAPSGGSQTVVSDNVPISTDLTADDLVPPTAPDGLRALPSALDEIVLAWNAATDNIGVVSYEIRRDGTLVGSSTFPAFIDSPLEAGVDFSYTVSAVDVSGNVSVESAIATAQTLAAPDVTAPPAPTSLLLVPGVDSVAVRWSQSAISDVASFRVLRGVGGNPLNQLGRVSSTAFIDAGLNGGVEHCYQVFTADASENESTPSDVVCATTGGSPAGGVQTPTPTPNPQIPVASGGALLDVDVSGLQCLTDLDIRSIDTLMTLDQPCYNVIQRFDVEDGGQLILNAGTVLKFAANTGIDIRQGGSITSNGTPEAPVVLSANDPTPGIWEGLNFTFSNSSRNVLNYTVVEFGGSSTTAGIETVSTSNSPTRLMMNNVLVRNSSGFGFEIDGDTILADTTGLISTGNATAIKVALDSISNISADSRFEGNVIDRVELIDGTTTAPVSLPNLGIPYSADRIRVSSAMSIAAGTRIEFEAGGSLDVDSDGSLSAVGTAQLPIVLTGRETTPGFWEGVDFTFSNSVNNRLENVVVEYAGSLSTNGGGLVTTSTSSSPTRVSVVNSIFRFNSGPGFRLRENTLVDEFANVQSTGNELSGLVGLGGITALGDNNDFTGNMNDGVRLFNQTLTEAAVWPAINVPYLVDQVRVEGPLTLSAGSQFIVDTGGTFNVRTDGTVNAQGTALAPIEFLGSAPTPGHWDGFSFTFARGPHTFDHVSIAHAGGGGTPATRGAVSGLCTTGSPVTINVSNTTISNSASNGVYGNADSCIINVDNSTTTFSNIAGENILIGP